MIKIITIFLLLLSILFILSGTFILNENENINKNISLSNLTNNSNFTINYNWVNISDDLNLSLENEYDYIIIENPNIFDDYPKIDNVYGLISFSNYNNSQTWYNSKIAEIDVWIDIHNVNVIITDVDKIDKNKTYELFTNISHYVNEKNKKVVIFNLYQHNINTSIEVITPKH